MWYNTSFYCGNKLYSMKTDNHILFPCLFHMYAKMTAMTRISVTSVVKNVYNI